MKKKAKKLVAIPHSRKKRFHRLTPEEVLIRKEERYKTRLRKKRRRARGNRR